MDAADWINRQESGIAVDDKVKIHGKRTQNGVNILNIRKIKQEEDDAHHLLVHFNRLRCASPSPSTYTPPSTYPYHIPLNSAGPSRTLLTLQDPLEPSMTLLDPPGPC